MAEIIRHRGKALLSERLGVAITPETKGVTIGSRHFDSAIALIGDGTGLEALKAAASHPKAAVVVVDPLANHFAGNMYTQLSDSHFRGIDWSFFTGSPLLRDSYGIFGESMSYRPDTVRQIEREYSHFHKQMKTIGPRIFLATGKTQTVEADAPIFDEVRVTYPESSDILAGELPPLFEFLNSGLRDNGICRIATDIFPYYEGFLKFAYPQITQHGRVQRDGGAVAHPLSLYDITNGSGGYFYVDMKKNRPFPEMGVAGFILRDMAYSIGLLGLARLTFSQKKKDLKK